MDIKHVTQVEDAAVVALPLILKTHLHNIFQLLRKMTMVLSG